MEVGIKNDNGSPMHLSDSKQHDMLDSSIDFEWFLELEKQRSLRLSGSVSVVNIDFTRLSTIFDKTNGNSPFDRILGEVEEAIKANTRRSDLFFPFDYRMKLILSNTAKRGACLAGDRLVSIVGDTLNHVTNSRGTDLVEVEIDSWDFSDSKSYEKLHFGTQRRLRAHDKPAIYPDGLSKTVEPLTSVGVLSYWQSFMYKGKRAIDFTGAFMGLLVLSPIMLLIAAAIKLTSPGPVFFAQDRVGRNGKVFKFIKFRSMYVNADDVAHREYVTKLIKGQIAKEKHASDKALFKLQNDARITRVGQFLRKYSLDELPQLVNVLKGEMSLVGPRPAIPYEVKNYSAWHMQRFNVLPGITGLWQVNGRSRTTFSEMVRYDIKYIRNWSLWLDLKILLRTIPAVLSSDGAL